MQAVTSVGDVCGADILIGRKQVLHSYREKRPQRYLKGKRRKIDVVVTARAGVKIDVVISDTDTVKEVGRLPPRLCSRNLAAVLRSHMFLKDGKDSFDPARFAHVGVLRHSVVCPHDIFAQTQSRPSLASAGAWRLCLQPIKQRQA